MRRTSSFLIVLGLPLVWVPAMADQKTDIEVLINNLVRLPSAEALPVAGCESSPALGQRPALMAPFGNSGLKSGLADWNCQDIFAEHPPSWTGAKPAEPWWPLCTAVRFEQERWLKRSVPEIYPATSKFAVTSDLCAQPSGNRYAKSYVAPTQEERKLSKPSQEAVSGLLAQVLQKPSWQNDREAQIQKIRGQTIRSCCADLADEPERQKRCTELLTQVQIRWCKPESDPRKPDPCIESLTHYHHDSYAFDKQLAFFKKYVVFDDKAPDGVDPESVKNAAQQAKREFPVDAGFVQLSPMLNPLGEPLNDDGVVAHELGHACSSVRQQLAIESGDPDALLDLYNAFYDEKSCALTPASRVTYGKKYHDQALSVASTQCLMDMSQGALKRRFSAEPCERGCPRYYLEESVAELLRAKTLDADQWFPLVIPNACSYRRDSLHPFSWDVVACFVKTPDFLQRAKKIIGCKER